MCEYTQVEFRCGHLRFTVRAWCSAYEQSHRRCPPSITAVEWRCVGAVLTHFTTWCYIHSIKILTIVPLEQTRREVWWVVLHLRNLEEQFVFFGYSSTFVLISKQVHAGRPRRSHHSHQHGFQNTWCIIIMFAHDQSTARYQNVRL